MTNPIHHIFGIRHHGPGSARNLVGALTRQQPDVVLIEGPPEADPIINLAANSEMKPPVALLVYLPDEPKYGVFYPFAVFSPEWCAIQFAANWDVPIRFIDLGQSHQLALDRQQKPEEAENEAVKDDPLPLLAQAAGYPTFESWWDTAFERRLQDTEIFDAVLEAMSAVRENLDLASNRIEQLREASMRQAIRKAANEGYENIAVICGAWHAPALLDIGIDSEAVDLKLLEKLPCVKTAVTWVPWSNGRLSLRSGYGAGISSPGWYEHLWRHPQNIATGWMTKVAQLLREHDLTCSPSDVIHAVRLSETLASVRGLPVPGLSEMNDAASSVFSFGSDIPLRLISEKLIIGDVLGQIPEESTMVPLQQDFINQQKTLRLPSEVGSKQYDFDLRKPTDLERSHFLHRVVLIGIPWGNVEKTRGAKGTFHELWSLQWRPDYALNIIEASIYGSTVADASNEKATELARASTSLPELTGLLSHVLLCELPSAADFILHQLDERAAVAGDVAQIMDSIPTLIDVLRYGTVRKIDSSLVARVIHRLVVRLSISLPLAGSSLDDDAASQMLARIIKINAAVNLNKVDEQIAVWRQCVQTINGQNHIHRLIAGRTARILLDSGVMSSDQCSLQIEKALGSANNPLESAAWLEGFLQDSGQILLLDESLWTAVDQWLNGIDKELFLSLVPLIRRTFATFPSSERRQLGQRVKQGNARNSIRSEERGFDIELADHAIPLLKAIFGLTQPVTRQSS